uniref:PHD-type domain-containing protein n=1 Tax=Heterorhabditis bacteriophora TaxID=37862 RepID=A0A1I7XTW9_HETBA
MNRDETYWADVWFHGDCILWAPDVYMKGNSLTNLDSKINQFWKQKCCLCHHEGAAIPVGDKYVHFPCAKKHGYHMNEALFSCHA